MISPVIPRWNKAAPARSDGSRCGERVTFGLYEVRPHTAVDFRARSHIRQTRIVHDRRFSPRCCVHERWRCSGRVRNVIWQGLPTKSHLARSVEEVNPLLPIQRLGWEHGQRGLRRTQPGAFLAVLNAANVCGRSTRCRRPIRWARGAQRSDRRRRGSPVDDDGA